MLLFWQGLIGAGRGPDCRRRGGRIGTYGRKYQGLRTSAETVIIRRVALGRTIMLAGFPRQDMRHLARISVSIDAWDFGPTACKHKPQAPDVYSMYPTRTAWIDHARRHDPRMLS